MLFRHLLIFVILSVSLSFEANAQQDYARFGQIALMRGNFSEAIRHLENAKRKSPNSINVLWMLGYSYFSNGDYANALKTFDRLVMISPREIRAYYQRGKSRQKIFELNKSLNLSQQENLLQYMIADFSQSISLSRFASVEFYQNRGLAYRNYALLKLKNGTNNEANKKSTLDLLKKSNDDFEVILEMRPARRDISEFLHLNLQLMRQIR